MATNPQNPFPDLGNGRPDVPLVTDTVALQAALQNALQYAAEQDCEGGNWAKATEAYQRVAALAAAAGGAGGGGPLPDELDRCVFGRLDYASDVESTDLGELDFSASLAWDASNPDVVSGVAIATGTGELTFLNAGGIAGLTLVIGYASTVVGPITIIEDAGGLRVDTPVDNVITSTWTFSKPVYTGPGQEPWLWSGVSGPPDSTLDSATADGAPIVLPYAVPQGSKASVFEFVVTSASIFPEAPDSSWIITGDRGPLGVACDVPVVSCAIVKQNTDPSDVVTWLNPLDGSTTIEATDGAILDLTAIGNFLGFSPGVDCCDCVEALTAEALAAAVAAGLGECTSDTAFGTDNFTAGIDAGVVLVTPAPDIREVEFINHSDAVVGVETSKGFSTVPPRGAVRQAVRCDEPAIEFPAAPFPLLLTAAGSFGTNLDDIFIINYRTGSA